MKSSNIETLLVGLFYEVNQTGQDIDSLYNKVKAGILGSALYSSGGPEQKTEIVSNLDSIYQKAKTLITLKS
ncbi:MAG: hypothetical protein HEEMFOPI_02031 [Holosporales bacterium]